MDADGGAKKGIAPTGAKNPSICRFPTLTAGLKVVPDGGVVIATGTNSVPDNWLPSTSYATGSKVTPDLPNGHEYQASIGGKSEPKTEPDWPTDGGAVLDGDTDGGVTWVDIGLVQPVVFDNETFPLTIPSNASVWSTGCGVAALDVFGCNAQAWIIALNNGADGIVLGDGASLQGFEVIPTTGGQVPDSAISCTGGTIQLDELILSGTSLVDSTLHMNRGILDFADPQLRPEPREPSTRPGGWLQHRRGHQLAHGRGHPQGSLCHWQRRRWSPTLGRRERRHRVRVHRRKRQ